MVDINQVQFLMIDTIVLSGQSCLLGCHTSLSGAALRGPEDKPAAEAQWDWIEQTLKESTATYIVVAGATSTREEHHSALCTCVCSARWGKGVGDAGFAGCAHVWVRTHERLNLLSFWSPQLP